MNPARTRVGEGPGGPRQDADTTDPGLQLVWLEPAQIEPNPRQPRAVMDPDSLRELADSIREVGLLQPILVRRSPGGAGYQLVAGERRLRASQLAGLPEIPAILRETGDAEMLREALLENLQRAELNPLEEAAAYQQLIADFDCSHDELAARLGRSRPHISNMLRLLRLPPPVARRVAAGVITQGHARALLGLADSGAMEEMATRIVAEGLSVRAVEELVALSEPRSSRQRRRKPATAGGPGLEGYAAALSDRLDTRVSVSMGQRKGKVLIEFAGVDDLERIMALLKPGTQSAGDAGSPHSG